MAKSALESQLEGVNTRFADEALAILDELIEAERVDASESETEEG